MKSLKNKAIATILTLSLALPFGAGVDFAHFGGIDRYGGHYVRTAGHGYKVGTYHYHKGKYSRPGDRRTHQKSYSKPIQLGGKLVAK